MAEGLTVRAERDYGFWASGLTWGFRSRELVLYEAGQSLL